MALDYEQINEYMNTIESNLGGLFEMFKLRYSIYKVLACEISVDCSVLHLCPATKERYLKTPKLEAVYTYEDVKNLWKYEDIPTIKSWLFEDENYNSINSYVLEILKYVDTIRPIIDKGLKTDFIVDKFYEIYPYFKSSTSKVDEIIAKETCLRVLEVLQTIRELSDQKIYILDTETTGTSKSARILQLSIIEIDNSFNITNSYNWYFKRNTLGVEYNEEELEALNIHGLSDEVLESKGAVEFKDVMLEIKDILSGKVVLGHRIMFDIMCLNNYFKDYGVSNIYCELVCTYNNRGLYRSTENYKLETIVNSIQKATPEYINQIVEIAYGENNEVSAHDSMYDTAMCYCILEEYPQLINVY